MFSQPWQAKLHQVQAMLVNSYKGGAYISMQLPNDFIKTIENDKQLFNKLSPYVVSTLSTLPVNMVVD